MTQNRRFKKRVRARMAATGESYSAAYQLLRNSQLEEQPMTEQFQLINDQDFGYSLELPTSWRDVGPDIYNSTFEVARYLRKSGDIHAGIVNVFWDIPGDSLRSLTETGNSVGFDINLKDLKEEGVDEVSSTDTEIDGRESIRIDWATSLPEYNVTDWATRSYFFKVRGKFVCLNMGTSTRKADAMLFDQIAASFCAIEDTVSIVLKQDTSTPADFVADVLESEFQYTKRKARQRSVRMSTQNESVVAIVSKQSADEIIESVASLSQQSGQSLTARVAS